MAGQKPQNFFRNLNKFKALPWCCFAFTVYHEFTRTATVIFSNIHERAADLDFSKVVTADLYKLIGVASKDFDAFQIKMCSGMFQCCVSPN